MCKVICLGEVLFDCIAKDLGASLAEVKSWTRYVGGAPANVASALVKLGTSAAFIGCVGKDTLGDDACFYLAQQGVETNGIQRTSQFSTRQVYVLRSDSGDRSFAGFSEPSPHTFADTCLEANKLPETMFKQAEYLVIGTLGLAYPSSKAAILKALELATKYDLQVVLDVNHRPVFWQDLTTAKPLIQQILPKVDYLKLAKEEALWLLATTDASQISNTFNSLRGVVITDGSAMVNYCFQQHVGSIKPQSVEVKDTTGAGDGFVAGLIHQLSNYKITDLDNPQTFAEIITYACAVGSLVTTQEGAIASQPTATQVKQFLARTLEN